MADLYSVAALKAEIARGKQPKYLFFWGHRIPKSGALTKSCLSQWYDAPFKVNGERFATAEHWMMAQKASLFDQRSDIRARIVASDDPKTAKALGRQVQGFDLNIWNQKKFDIVVEGNVHKFSQNKALGQFLLNTRDRVLVEASPVDPVWRIGLRETDGRVYNPKSWQGENLLGFALMVARDRLAAGV